MSFYDNFAYTFLPNNKARMPCPYCDFWNTRVVMTGKSVKFECNKCYKTMFYRRVDNI